jgi:hypothetical protein
MISGLTADFSVKPEEIVQQLLAEALLSLKER